MQPSPSPMAHSQPNHDPHEIAKFDAMAARFWDPLGPFRPLHELNPLRLAFIERYVRLAGTRCLDVGCGGGLLAEALARAHAKVTAIDLSKALIQTAQMHAMSEQLSIDYRHLDVADLPGDTLPFAEIMCLEMLEHVPDPASLLRQFNRLLPLGGGLTLSTLNRSLSAYLVAIIGAEYLLKRLPIGTHDYARFIKPSELGRSLTDAGFEVVAIQGLAPKWLSTQMGFSDSVQINYLMRAEKRRELSR
jgi:2-polyprenyl-6-hydroxyphenyl methylase / 3-demethylubiquinone-9 3-methyltransferase